MERAGVDLDLGQVEQIVDGVLLRVLGEIVDAAIAELVQQAERGGPCDADAAARHAIATVLGVRPA